jgi:phage terminase large subunit-like protein
LISKSSHLAEKTLSNVNRWTNLEGVVWQYKQVSHYLDNINEQMGLISKSLDTIEIIVQQNTDEKLFTLIRQIISIADLLVKETNEINNMKIRHGEGEFDYKTNSITPVFPIVDEIHLTKQPSDLNDEPNKQVAYQSIRCMEITTVLFKNIRQCNKRIEDLLSGVED